MEIVRRTIQRAGRGVVVAWIDAQGLDTGPNTFIGELDTDEDSLGVNPNDPVILDRFKIDLNKVYFFIDTYRKLIEEPQSTWDDLLRPANGFLAHLSPEDSQELFNFFLDARLTIDEEIIILGRSLTDTSVAIGNKLYDVAVRIDLPAKLLYYCRNFNLPIPDLSYAGTKIGQHREEMTFREDEYYLAMAISVLCKLLCPIWGDLIYRTTRTADTMQKEALCVDVILPVLGMKLFRDVSNKLFEYIASVVDAEMSKSYTNASFTAAVKGFSKDRFHQIIYATMLIKRYVNVNFYAEDGNLMVWTNSSAKNAFVSQLQSLTKKCQVMPRIDISDQQSGDEESSVSVLEHSSRTTTVTADIPVLIKLGIMQSIGSICRNLGVSSTDLDRAMGYYLQSSIQVTPINRTLVGILLGSKIGGARGLRYLNHIDYMRLVAITQIYVAEQMRGSLAHLLTTTISPIPKSEFSLTDTRITSTFTQSGEYKACVKNTYAIDDISSVTILNTIKDQIVRNIHLVNTAPIISTIMEETPLEQNSVFEYDEMVMRNLCILILQILSKENYQLSGV